MQLNDNKLVTALISYAKCHTDRFITRAVKMKRRQKMEV